MSYNDELGLDDRLKDFSGATAAGDKIAVPAMDDKQFIFIVNLSDSITYWVNFGAVATVGAGSIPIRAGESFSFSPITFISSAVMHIRAEDGSADNAYTIKVGLR